jgi:3'-phosphoadenosine 5'-phosphosulfate sulfotransferase
MKTLRKIINKTKWDRMRNDRIRELCEIQNITSWVQRRRIEWSEHISRMADGRLVRKVRDGQPMKRWSDALE